MMGLIQGIPTKRDAELAAEATRESWQAILDRLAALVQAKSLPERQNTRNDALGAIHVHMSRRSYENRINWQIERDEIFKAIQDQSSDPAAIVERLRAMLAKPEAPSAPIPPPTPAPKPEPSPRAQAKEVARQHQVQAQERRDQELANSPPPEPIPPGTRLARCDINNDRRPPWKPSRSYGPIYGGGDKRGLCNNKAGEGCRCEVPSDPSLPFFKAQPDKPFDAFFCGCQGWE